MNEDAIIQYITTSFEDIETLTVTGNTFFFYDPEQKFPFVTIVVNDDYDQVSKLNRPAVFRLNIGVSKQTYQSLFGSAQPAGEEYDFAALDKVLPHPVYGRMYWICVLNPSLTTFQQLIEPLLAEAYNLAANKYSKHKKHSLPQAQNHL